MRPKQVDLTRQKKEKKNIYIYIFLIVFSRPHAQLARFDKLPCYTCILLKV